MNCSKCPRILQAGEVSRLQAPTPAAFELAGASHSELQSSNCALGTQKAMQAFSPLHFGGTPVTTHLSVADADAVFARATAAGAKSVMPVQETFWGARYGVITDPFGHSWSIATQVRQLSQEEIQKNMEAQFCQGLEQPEAKRA